MFLTLVQGLIVGPTPNPSISFLFRRILFRRNDFPVLYFPATAIIPIFSFIFPSNWIASGLTWNPISKTLKIKNSTFFLVECYQIYCFFLEIFLDLRIICHWLPKWLKILTKCLFLLVLFLIKLFFLMNVFHLI